MEIKKVKLSKIKVNGKNPRTITDDKMRRLIDSILVFPKMLEIRPVVIDDKFIALGGNMRTRALKEIKKIGRDGLLERLQQVRQYTNKPAEEQNELLTFWNAWFQEETVPVCLADTLTEDEKNEFIIKDNAAFGAWDWDLLANEWNVEELDDWGIDVWQQPTDEEIDNFFNLPDEEQEEKPECEKITLELPEELDGVDINPDDLPKIEGEDETEYQRIILVYKPEESEKLAALLGIEKVDKVVYKVEELT